MAVPWWDEIRKTCRHPIFVQENKIGFDGRAYTYCKECMMVLWEQAPSLLEDRERGKYLSQISPTL